MSKLSDDIYIYWSGRASGYSEYNRQEMADERKNLWEEKLLQLVKEKFPGKEPEELTVLDAGCGPGFFTILLAKAGFHVTALDYTESMIEEAKQNAGAEGAKVRWMTGDVQKLSFESESFDFVVTRNVTWNLPEPEKAYQEWFRVLKKGGWLFNFDADWYGHLFDDEKKRAFEQDRRNVEAEGSQDYYGDTDNDWMDDIARQVPLSKEKRPVWDEDTMARAGFAWVTSDTEVWKEVWTREEILNNASTPIFLVSGQKKRDPFCLNNAVVESGSTWKGELKLQGGVRVPAAILHGKRDGKTALITAGIHAAEYVGIQTAMELSGQLQIDRICGTIIIVIVVNRPAFETRSGSLGLTDQKNLNRVFPGSPDGSEMEKLAHAVVEDLQKKADYYIDLHSGDAYETLTPYVYYAGKTDEATAAASRKMAEQVDVPYMVCSDVASGGSYNYAASCGIPSILIERGQMGGWSTEEVSSTKRDVRNVLCHLGIYDGERDYRKYYPLEVTELVYQGAENSGLWYPRKQVGDIIVKGELLGEVLDYYGNVLESSTAVSDGVVLYQTGSLQVVSQGTMITYGRIQYSSDDRKERIVSYWGKRSESFLAQRRAELRDEISKRWMKEIHKYMPQSKNLRILDVGCGAGFFSILLAKEGHEVIGIDLTPEMIQNARLLAEEEGVTAEFRVMDAEQPDFPEESFDVVISRNLTWTLPHPKMAYESWKKLLKPGGVLLNFDANYGKSDFADTKDLPKTHAHHMIGEDLLREGEELKRQLPISSYSRPAWDLETLGELGYKEFHFDLGVSSRIYLAIDEFYNPTPLFFIAAKK